VSGSGRLAVAKWQLAVAIAVAVDGWQWAGGGCWFLNDENRSSIERVMGD
jgi:hypothetical protein